MSLFFITFFTLYGLLHLYAFLKAKAALSFSIWQGAPLVIFMAAMTFAPAIVRYLEQHELEVPARIMSYTGYIWMGILVLFFAMALCIDIYRLLLNISGLMFDKDLSSLTLSFKMSFFIPLIFALASAVYGYFEAKNIRVEQVTVKTSKLSKEAGRIRIVQISDLHVGLIVREERLKRIISQVLALDPDILVSSGDLVDGQIDRIEGIADILKDVRPRYGKFAITGNHEYYAGIQQSLAFTKKAGFKVLRGQAVSIKGIITIAGVDDRTGMRFGSFSGTPETELLSGLDQDKFIILLKHKPIVDRNSLGTFDLQLSGHTHKGQLFPFNLVTKLYFPRHAGYVRLPRDSALYISRGTGTWGPPMRVLSPPEVTVIDLVPEG